MGRDERLYTSVTEEQKTDFEIAAMRRDMKPSELLHELVAEFLTNEDIPDDVRQYFHDEFSDEGNRRVLATTTAD